ncbi:hypothetical protein V496_07796 [Pseudogymnoascus sp. VKM F-4515 (FW-2607)]|nr:hypothetical protein V496_07796 [Pseudogymnoascus sp. VKM F-4515 (FW-2607)]KFY97169.1 hypothetical protein V498_02211 [Pseudogymnoascus sp. VKM F-4517 (FW-2822)]
MPDVPEAGVSSTGGSVLSPKPCEATTSLVAVCYSYTTNASPMGAIYICGGALYHTDYYTAVQLRVYATRTFSLHPLPTTVPCYTIRILSSTPFPIIATFLTPEVTAVHVFPLTALRSPSSSTAARAPRRRRHNYYFALPRPPARLDPLLFQHSTNQSHILPGPHNLLVKMATPHRGNDEGKGTAEEAGQADRSNNVAEDGSEYEIELEGPTMTDVFSMEPLQNGEWFGVHEGDSWNGSTFAGLPQRPPTLTDEDLRLSARNLAAIHIEPPHDPLDNWLRSIDSPVTDLLRLLGLREERLHPQRRPTKRNHKHKPQQRK